MKTFLIAILMLLLIPLQAQVGRTEALAKQYYQTGDYSKAASLYEELWKDNPSNTTYYHSLYSSYIRINDYEAAEKVVKKQIKKNKDDLSLQIDLGYLYAQNNQAKLAEDSYNEVLLQLPPDLNAIRFIANKFINLGQTDFAIRSYIHGRDILKDKTLFSFELGSAYLRDNNAKEAVATYLQSLEINPSYARSVQSILSSQLDKKEIQDALETQLYALVQKNPNKTEYAEMLIWLFTHQEDYEQALLQAKALDKRNQEDGGRVILLADNALAEQQFEAAIEGYKYIQTKGQLNRFYQIAKSNEIKAKKLKVTTTQNFTDEDISELYEAYKTFIASYGVTSDNINALREQANLEAYYLHDIDAAINTLESITAISDLSKKDKNIVKLDLGDFYVLSGDVWEATLLYAQVDKDERDSPLGEDARYRNARLSYYKGEFEWAQAQLGILKGATTELIANNALELSIFILDNLGLDTTTATMEMFAKAELLHKQNKDAEAISSLDELLSQFPGHALTDDVLYQKGMIAFENKNHTEAAKLFEQVVTQHGEDILADNAAFKLGDIYQYYLNDSEKAMHYYKKIITDYSGSVLLVEARKRFRHLRGDGI